MNKKNQIQIINRTFVNRSLFIYKNILFLHSTRNNAEISMKNKRKYIEPIIHIIFWLSGYLIFLFLVKTVGPFKRIDDTLIIPVTIGTIFNLILFYTTSLYLIPGVSEKKRAREFILQLLTLFSILTLTETLIDSLLFVYYYSDRPESFFSQFLLTSILNFIIISLALAYGFIKNWLKNEKMRQLLKQEKLSAELNFLKTQLNPHFLFNVLNMAFSSASRNGDEVTADIIEKLSGLMRYMLYESNVEYIELEKEIEYIRNYINLQKMRFSEDMRVKVDFKINGDFSGCRIAPLILIQFIENAFKFGVKLEKESEIIISLIIVKKDIEFSVKNSIFMNQTEAGEKASGIGIENVKKRLSIIYPGKHELVAAKSGNYFNVKLLMKLE